MAAPSVPLTFTGVAPGAHNVTVRSTTDITCVSAATPLTVNAVQLLRPHRLLLSPFNQLALFRQERL